MKKNFKLLAGNPDFWKNQIVLKSGQLKTDTILQKIVFFVVFSYSLFTLQTQAQQTHIFTTGNSDLPSNNVTSIAIDAQGNKWFGTNTGVVAKFDNVNWTVYDSSNSGLPGDYIISTIVIDKQDNKWIGLNYSYTQGDGAGLVKFDNTNWTVYNQSNSGLPNNKVSRIDIDSFGNKWIGTWGGGVAKFDDSIWVVYNSANSDLPDDYISEIEIDDLGNKWIAAQGGIAKCDDTSWTVYDYNSILPAHEQGFISSIAIDDKGNKWFGVSDESWDPEAAGGVAVFDNQNWSFYNSTNSGLPYGVYSIANDGRGSIWFGTAHTWNYSDAAVAKFDGSKWTVYNYANSGMPNVLVSSIAIDAQGNKWFGTPNIGVVVFNENGIKTGLSDRLSDSSDDFTVYPNPAKDLISIEGMSTRIVQIFNSSGQIVKNLEAQGMPANVDISNLPEGIYTVRIRTKDKVVSKKFIKK